MSGNADYESELHPAPASARAGYTLPVFACAGAIAALRHLLTPLAEREPVGSVSVNLLEPPESALIPIEQLAGLSDRCALAITRSDPGDNLDLTRNTAIWSQVELDPPEQTEPWILVGGEGIGRQLNRGGQAAIYRYAQRLLWENLAPLIPAGTRLRVTIALPEGRALALRTSNAAFGVVDGLSLLGTSGISQPLSAPAQLDAFREQLRAKAAEFDSLVFCIGENGLDLAPALGLPRDRLLKTANWLGPLLVEAGLLGVKRIVLFGYHGKLIKLAAGIFHTHHHVADGRLETLCAIAAVQGLPQPLLQRLLDSPTVEAGLGLLAEVNGVQSVYAALAERIDGRAAEYIRKQSEAAVQVGCILFDRQRRVIVASAIAQHIQATFPAVPSPGDPVG